jgi:hypothetical protein
MSGPPRHTLDYQASCPAILYGIEAYQIDRKYLVINKLRKIFFVWRSFLK